MPDRPYSQAIRVSGHDLVFCCGQTARHLTTGEVLFKGDAGGQFRQILQNLRSLLEAAGGSLEDVIQLRIFYTRREDIPEVLSIRREYFTRTPYPAVTGIVCGLVHPDMLIEVDAIAAL